MQSQREWPADINGCKDKFLVQSCASGGSTDFTELFAKGKEGLSESSRVSYAQPAPPPSPVPEGEEGDGKESTDAPSASASQMYSSKSVEVASKPMPSDVAGLRRELERYRIKNDGLTADLNAALRSNKNGGVVRGFSLLHLLITGACRPIWKKRKNDPFSLSPGARVFASLGASRLRPPRPGATSSPFPRPFGEPTPTLPFHRRDSVLCASSSGSRTRSSRETRSEADEREIASRSRRTASATQTLTRPRSPPSSRP